MVRQALGVEDDAVARTGAARHEHPRFARAYIELAAVADRRGSLAHRRRLLAGLTGSVVEVGAGHGGNFALYPRTVTSVLAVEPEPTFRSHAVTAAGEAPVPVTVVDATAEALPAPDRSVDAVVFSLVLCSVSSVQQALAEARRVLRPGGTLVAYEHVRSANPAIAWLEDVIAPAWSLLAAGCHPNRDPVSALADAGFAVQGVDRFLFSPSRGVPATAHVLVEATRPVG
jgi:SAM-dependent methyltransferase